MTIDDNKGRVDKGKKHIIPIFITTLQKAHLQVYITDVPHYSLSLGSNIKNKNYSVVGNKVLETCYFVSLFLN